MKIPAPNEFAKQGGYNPFPPRWERWLSAVREGILSAQPQAGRHVSIDERPGKGTVINVDRRPGGAAVGACCNTVWPDFTCTVQSEADCISAGGSYAGDGTVCESVDCLSGACCAFSGLCIDTQDFSCNSPDIWNGYGTTCAGTRCEGACAVCDACASECTCHTDLTYDECQEFSSATVSIGWLLDGDCITNDCCYFFGGPPCCGPGDSQGVCCGEGGCLDSVTQELCSEIGGTFWQESMTCVTAILCGHSECGT